MQRFRINNLIPKVPQRNFIRKFGKDAHAEHHKQDHKHEEHHEDHGHGDHHHVDPASLGYGPKKPDYTEYHLIPHWRATIGTYFIPLASLVTSFLSA